MGYYTMHRVETGDILVLSAEPIDDPNDPTVRIKYHQGALPPLAKYRWNKEWLGFELIEQPAISRLAFRNRFTHDEKRALYTAAETNIDIRIWLDDLATTSVVVLDNPQTVVAVNMLETFGLIAPGRAAEILTTPISETEIPG